MKHFKNKETGHHPAIVHIDEQDLVKETPQGIKIKICTCQVKKHKMVDVLGQHS